MISCIGFDADDTLWQNETFFRLTEARFIALLGGDPGLTERLHEAEKRNLGHYGFGVKGFMLSMIETAIEATEGQVKASVIAEILAEGREMLRHPIHLLPDVEEVVRALAQDHRVIVITKGDLLDQERKLAQSGLGDLFHGVEIVSDKTPETYARAFARHGAGADHAMMVGNSLKSDVIPALQAGAWGVHIPHELTWSYERADPPTDAPRFRVIQRLAELPDVVNATLTHNR
ncbi:HAD family hydrolase [Stagnihabitans tardus]|uniref:HAD family hydrolase n=1 Tax=Stagnihabitans tardus TaxID=2699202 RepID=A0AAE4YC81_9RHOB|nr:HAD family hydrolase [Stagnihabitans tardus]NBZ87250.1 HAD family hydrolase [Stagnihabitans tardus]